MKEDFVTLLIDCKINICENIENINTNLKKHENFINIVNLTIINLIDILENILEDILKNITSNIDIANFKIICKNVTKNIASASDFNIVIVIFKNI